MTKLRLRNLMLPVALAVIAAVLVGIYIVSYRNSVTEGAGLVKVLVASRDIPASTRDRRSRAAAISRPRWSRDAPSFPARSSPALR